MSVWIHNLTIACEKAVYVCILRPLKISTMCPKIWAKSAYVPVGHVEKLVA